jgi:hypothetical protein
MTENVFLRRMMKNAGTERGEETVVKQNFVWKNNSVSAPISRSEMNSLPREF